MTVTAATRHQTASMVVLDPGDRSVLLVHHRASGLWQFPGGHVEADEQAWEAARREVFEETGIEPVLHCLNVWRREDHPAPEKPERGEPAHIHDDWLFVGTADSTAVLRPAEGEVSQVTWVPVDDMRWSEARSEVPRYAREALDLVLAGVLW